VNGRRRKRRTGASYGAHLLREREGRRRRREEGQ